MEEGEEIALVRTISNSSNGGVLQFQYSMIQAGNQTKITIVLDNAVLATMDRNARFQTSPQFGFSSNSHVVKWVVSPSSQHSGSERTQVLIHWVALTGTGEGGAPVCTKCPLGQVSSGSAAQCVMCPAGSAASPDQFRCEECVGNTYSCQLGCTECPRYTTPTPRHDACTGLGNITEPFTFQIEPLIGNNPKTALCSKVKFRHLCAGAMYGPVIRNESFFYISVLNPSEFHFSPYVPSDDLSLGYAFAIMNSIGGPVSSSSQASEFGDKCSKKAGKAIVNVGTRIQFLETHSAGFDIGYSDGSLCDSIQNVTFSSQLHFLCDKTIEDGWPLLIEQVNCTYSFLWRSKHACPICANSAFTMIRGKCRDGRRPVHLKEEEGCIASIDAQVEFEEPCSETRETINTWPIVLGGVLIFGLLGLVAGLCYCFRRVKTQYERLIDFEDGRQST